MWGTIAPRPCVREFNIIELSQPHASVGALAHRVLFAESKLITSALSLSLGATTLITFDQRIEPVGKYRCMTHAYRDRCVHALGVALLLVMSDIDIIRIDTATQFVIVHGKVAHTHAMLQRHVARRVYVRPRTAGPPFVYQYVRRATMRRA